MDNKTYKNIADEKIASFDCTYTSNHIRMLKIILHYIPWNLQKNIIFYIKFLELQQVLTTPFRNFPPCNPKQASENSDTSGFSSLIHELLPYCNPREEQQFRNFENIFNSFEQMKNMMDMLEMIKDMKDMFGDAEGGLDPEMLAGMMNGMGSMDGFDFSDFFSK